MKVKGIALIIAAAGCAGLTACGQPADNTNTTETAATVSLAQKAVDEVYNKDGIKIDYKGLTVKDGQPCYLLEVENNSGKDIQVELTESWVNDKQVESVQPEDATVSTYTFKEIAVPYINGDKEVQNVAFALSVTEVGGAAIDNTGIKRFVMNDTYKE